MICLQKGDIYIMEILHIIYTSAGSVAALFLLTKFIGYRQMSQLSMFDYINGITIGSIAAEMATALENDFVKPLTAMIVYALLTILFSKLAEKSLIARHFIVGKAILIYDKGILYYKNLKKASMDLDEFLSQCRISGYFHLEDLQTAVLEPNGRISFLPKSGKRPLTPEDIQLEPPADMPAANIIIDGHIMEENLKQTGRDRQWLQNHLKASGITDVRDVFLATCDIHGKICIYRKTKNPPLHNVLN